MTNNLLRDLRAVELATAARYASVEDALYSASSTVTIAITHEWSQQIDMLVLVKGFNVGEEVEVNATMEEATL
jgi:hypothetical protein